MEEKHDWIRQLMEEGLNREEKAQLESTLTGEELNFFRALAGIHEHTDNWEVPAVKSSEEAWNRIMDRIDDESRSSKVNIIPFYKNPTFVSWLAASVAMLLGVFFFFDYFGEKHIYTPNAKTQIVFFPDSSRAVLNAHSSLKYDKRNFYKNRKVELTGEAYFQIREGEPFEVNTRSGAVFVLGTEFNVLNRKRIFQVKCREGEVKVVLRDMNQSVVLQEGEATRMLNRKLMPVFNTEPDQIGSWQSGEFYFEEDPLILVINELERQFDVQIKTGDISGRKYSGHFRSDNFEEALKMVFEPMGLRYDIIDKRLVIVR